MAGFRDFDEILSSVNDPVFWEDVESDRAGRLIEKFSDYDWTQLESELPSRDNRWQARCAQVLSSDLHERSFQIIALLLSSKDYFVVLRATESLSDFDESFSLKRCVDSSVVQSAIEVLRNSALNESSKERIISNLKDLFER